MSDLRPKGIPVTIGGVERHFLFTLNAIDEIQDHYKMPLSEVIEKFADKEESYKTMRYVITVLLNDEAERENGQSTVTEKEVGWMITLENEAEIITAVFRAYGYSLPEGDKDPNRMSGTTKE